MGRRPPRRDPTAARGDLPSRKVAAARTGSAPMATGGALRLPPLWTKDRRLPRTSPHRRGPQTSWSSASSPGPPPPAALQLAQPTGLSVVDGRRGARGRCRRRAALGGAVPAGRAGRGRCRRRRRWRLARRGLWRRRSGHGRPGGLRPSALTRTGGPQRARAAQALLPGPSYGFVGLPMLVALGGRATRPRMATGPSPQPTISTVPRSASRSWWPWACSPPASPPRSPAQPGRCGRPGRGRPHDHP